MQVKQLTKLKKIKGGFMVLLKEIENEVKFARKQIAKFHGLKQKDLNFGVVKLTPQTDRILLSIHYYSVFVENGKDRTWIITL